MKAQTTKPYWKEFELIVSDSLDDGTPDVELRRDKDGKYHLIRESRKNCLEMEVTPRKAAEFCLRRLVPEELHSHFTIK